MRTFCARVTVWTVLLLVSAVAAQTGPPRSFQSLDPELGIVYRPPSVSWDGQQWNAIFADPDPPMGWAVLPVGKESCGAVNRTWLSKAKQK